MTEKICFIVTAIGESGTETRDRADEVFSYLIAPVYHQLPQDCSYGCSRYDRTQSECIL